MSDLVAKCLNFRKVKIEHRRSGGELVGVYQQEIVRLHGIPNTIVSDRDGRFMSRFWQKLFKAMRIKMRFSTAFRPQTDGQSERTI